MRGFRFATTIMPTRVVTLPVPRRLVSFAVANDAVHILMSVNDYETFITKNFEDAALQLLKENAEHQLKKWTSNGESLSEELRREIVEQAYIFAMREFLFTNGHKHAWPIAAIRYKGGRRTLLFHPVLEEEFRKKPNPFQRLLGKHEHIVKASPSSVHVTDERLQGKSGIFFSISIRIRNTNGRRTRESSARHGARSTFDGERRAALDDKLGRHPIGHARKSKKMGRAGIRGASFRFASDRYR